MTEGVDLVTRYLQKADWEIEENSNITFSLQGLQFYVAKDAARDYWLAKVYPQEAKEAHEKGAFHLHDLQVLAPYCEGWDLLDLLQQGFRGPSGKIESKPPKHFSSALGQIANFFYTLQGEAAGAQSLTNFDTLLAPFIHFDALSYAAIKQNLQEFIFNLNVPTRLGFQAPFTNLTMDIKPPRALSEMPVIIGGKTLNCRYGDFQKEIDWLNQAFLEIMEAGDAKERPFTFPIPTYNITKDFPWDAAHLEGLWRVCAKYGTPYFANFVNSDLSPEDVRSMCCRLRIDTRTLEHKGGGYFASNPLTGSVGVITLNMPQLGYLAKNKSDFFARLEALLTIAKNALEEKRKALEQWIEEGLYPYSKFYLRDMKKRFGAYFKNHFSTIGLVGMHECCLNLLAEGIASEKGKALAIETLDFMRDRLLRFQEETGNHYNLEATPAEGAAYRLLQIDSVLYPAMPALQEAGKGCYTNSTQLPVPETEDPFFALDHQDPLQVRYTGGTVLHFFLGERPENLEGLKSFIKKVVSGWRLPYFTITPTASICPVHGYLSGEKEYCWCGQKTEIYSRVVGYLRPTAHWNAGKKIEFKQRKPFKIDR